MGYRMTEQEMLDETISGMAGVIANDFIQKAVHLCSKCGGMLYLHNHGTHVIKAGVCMACETWYTSGLIELQWMGGNGEDVQP